MNGPGKEFVGFLFGKGELGNGVVYGDGGVKALSSFITLLPLPLPILLIILFSGFLPRSSSTLRPWYMKISDGEFGWGGSYVK